MTSARWLMDQCKVEHRPETLVDGLVQQLERDGLALVRVSAWLPTQHPELWGSQLMWRRGAGCAGIRRPHDIYDTPTFQGTPAQALFMNRQPIRCRLDLPRDQLRFPMLEEIAAAGGVEYFIIPIEMGERQDAAWMSFATDRPAGFSTAEIEVLDGLRELLSLHFQLLAERYAKHSLLEVYLGPNAAKRVLDGAFHRGTGELQRAAIWFCDLRGFTTLSDQLGARDTVNVLDQYFECVAAAIEAHGGEILKLIGDAALAIFAVGDAGPAEPCRHALDAAHAALAALDHVRTAHPEWPPLAMGVGLHLGDVLYGNIGGKSRLDFTVIGPAVNEVCRVESLCKTLGSPLLMTSTFAEVIGLADTVSLGHHALRGVSAPQELRTVRAFVPSLPP